MDRLIDIRAQLKWIKTQIDAKRQGGTQAGFELVEKLKGEIESENREEINSYLSSNHSLYVKLDNIV